MYSKNLGLQGTLKVILEPFLVLSVNSLMAKSGSCASLSGTQEMLHECSLN